MQDLLNFFKFIAILVAILVVVFLILLALPKSKLRQSILKIYAIVSMIFTFISAIYIASPIDALPDVIPVAGQTDDIAAAISALASAITGYVAWQKSKRDKTNS